MELEKFLSDRKIWYRLIEKKETVHTADAASATGLDLKRVTKSLVLLNEKNEPFVVIIPGDCRLDYKKITTAIGFDKIHLCPFEEAHKYTGYDPGATPPLCYKVKMAAIIFDSKLLAYKTIFGGGGARNKVIELKTQDVISINDAIVADVTK